MIDALRKFLLGRAQGYARCFKTPAGEDVLKDLARFCRARQSTFHPDARVSAVMEGRREVWLRIADHLHLSDDELYLKYAAPAIPAVKETTDD